MGLSIHYSGKLKDSALLPQLAEEVQDVCSVLGWRFRSSEDGFGFTPPESETFCFDFQPDGTLVNKMYLRYNIEPSNTVSVKTQFAGMDVHLAAVKLLKHLSKKYFAVFEVKDEGGYWETNDEEVLSKQFGLYNWLLDEVQTTLQDFKAEQGDTPQRLADRLENFLNARLRKKG
jgi:hypothetical protein